MSSKTIHHQPITLLYHAIGAAPRTHDAEERELFVDQDCFAWQMADLAHRGYRTLTLDDYAASLEGRRFPWPTVLLTFDDAYAHIKVVTPILRSHRFSAVVFAPWQHLGGLNVWDVDVHPNLAKLEIASPEEILAMTGGPWEVASHGLRHINLKGMGVAERRAELIEARERLSELVGRPVRDLAYPHGSQDEGVRRDAREAGYRMAFTAGPGTAGDPLQQARRPIRRSDSKALFRLKTSGWSSWMYNGTRGVPGWARSSARALINISTRRVATH
jgi:peptidoglycan/xylan/chitin deacetylase (PgdA/CDA1 family)